MPLTVRLSDQARVNILEIWVYIAENDNAVAARMAATKIIDKFGFLAENPNAGRFRRDLRAGIRSYPVGQYLIFYYLLEELVVISRVVHGARDLNALFESEPFDTFRMTEDGG